MERWKEWAHQNNANMEGHLYRAADRIAGNKAGSAAGSLLEALKQRTERWLEAVLRIIYNSGGYLVPLRI